MGDRWFASITDGEPEPEKGSGNPGWMRYLVPIQHPVHNVVEELKEGGDLPNGWRVENVNLVNDGKGQFIIVGEVVKKYNENIKWETYYDKKIKFETYYDSSGRIRKEMVVDPTTNEVLGVYEEGKVQPVTKNNLTDLLEAVRYRVRLLREGEYEGEYFVRDPKKFAEEFLREVAGTPSKHSIPEEQGNYRRKDEKDEEPCLSQ